MHALFLTSGEHESIQYIQYMWINVKHFYFISQSALRKRETQQLDIMLDLMAGEIIN